MCVLQIDENKYKPCPAYQEFFIPELQAKRTYQVRPAKFVEPRQLLLVQGKEATRGLRRILIGEKADASSSKARKEPELKDDDVLQELWEELQDFCDMLQKDELFKDRLRGQIGITEKEEKQNGTFDEQSKFWQEDIHYLLGPMTKPYNESRILKMAAKEETVMGNDGISHLIRDKGHDGMTLQDFQKKEQAEIAHLKLPEIAAIRLYTSSLFKVINNPLRNTEVDGKDSENREVKVPDHKNRMPHPLPVTTLLIERALKKLRAKCACQPTPSSNRIGVPNACGLAVRSMLNPRVRTRSHWKSNKKFQTQYLWRGLKDVMTTEHFDLHGGCDLACMSASPNLAVVAGYSKSEQPLILRFKVDSPMDLGADIAWLSMYPSEEEFVYPPLTCASCSNAPSRSRREPSPDDPCEDAPCRRHLAPPLATTPCAPQTSRRSSRKRSRTCPDTSSPSRRASPADATLQLLLAKQLPVPLHEHD